MKSSTTARVIIYATMFALTVIAFIFIKSINQAKADSLVCYYSGTTKIMKVYTEEEKNTEYNAVKRTELYRKWSQITFHDGYDIFFNTAIPCVQIEDEFGETTNLDAFLEGYLQ